MNYKGAYAIFMAATVLGISGIAPGFATDVPATLTVTAGATCSMGISGDLTFGSFQNNQDTGEKTLTFSNDGTQLISNVDFKSRNWDDNPVGVGTDQMAVAQMAYGTSTGTFASKTPLTTSDVSAITSLGATAADRIFQVHVSLTDPFFIGQLDSDLTATATCS